MCDLDLALHLDWKRGGKMKKILLGLVILLSIAVFVPPVLADFIGPYGVANWTTTLTGTPPGGGSTIDTSGAPASIQILGGNSECTVFPCTISFTIAAVASGIVSFHWDYQTFDLSGPIFEAFGFLLNGVFTQLSDDGGLNVQSGNEAFAVSLGNVFGFRLDCTDCLFGPANITISNFSAPVGAAVPEPGTLLLLGAGLLGLSVLARAK
jgi:PEP-CTERM motif